MVEAVVPKMDFSALADLPNTYREARLQRERKETLAALGQGATPQDVATRLFQIGDVQGGMSLANLGNAVEQQRFNRDQALFQRGIAERQIGLQERQAQEKPQYKTNDRGDIIEIKPSGTARVLPVEGASAPSNPFAPAGKQTEGEANASLYASRMMNSEKILREIESVGTDAWELGKSKVPLIGNMIVSDSFQKMDQAKRDFVNATLRRESGAVINKEEFDNANRQYFPMPGDSAETIKQKRANRAEAIRGIAAAGGKNFVPPYSFGQNGELVPNKPGQERGQVPQASPKLPTGYTPQRALDEAKAAIAAGKDRNAVIQRLQQLGIDPAGL